MRKGWYVSLVVAALVVPSVGWAQAPGLEVRLAPRVGAYIPASSLGEVEEGARQVAAEMEGSLALGLSAEIGLPLPFDLRASVDYATGTEVSLDDGTTQEGAGATLLAFTGDLVFRPLPRLVVVRPYLLGGAGYKRYDFELEDAEGDVTDFLTSEENDFTWHVGAGVDVALGPVDLYVEASDYISSFAFEFAEGGDGEDEDSETQHDVFLMVGFRVGML